MKPLMRGRWKHGWLWLLGLFVFILGGGFWVWPGLSLTAHWLHGRARYDEIAISTDLQYDLKLMWETRPLYPGTDPTKRGSTPRAIIAAQRVFNTVELVGMTVEEVIALLGHPKTASDSNYNFPFYPTRSAWLVYRFDTGSYGWQYNILCDRDGKVRKVERQGIE